jgi:hypothetical protein
MRMPMTSRSLGPGLRGPFLAVGMFSRPAAGPGTGRVGGCCWSAVTVLGSEPGKVRMVRRRSTVRFRKGALHVSD